jgi:hypothetical protein
LLGDDIGLFRLNLRLCSVHLVDSSLLTTPLSFLSAVLVSLSAMINLELPHVNLLSKIDVLKDVLSDGRTRLALPLEFFLQGGDGRLEDLAVVLEESRHPLGGQAKRFAKGLAEVRGGLRVLSMLTVTLFFIGITYFLLKIFTLIIFDAT